MFIGWPDPLGAMERFVYYRQQSPRTEAVVTEKLTDEFFRRAGIIA
jgi:hypothetical protein